MAIYTPQQLVSASNATYTTNGVGAISGASVRALNLDWISSSVLLDASNKITGSQVLSGSLRIINNTTAGITVTGSGGSSVTMDKRSYNALGINAPGVDMYSQIFGNDTGTAGQYIGVISSDFVTTDVEYAVVATATGLTFSDYDPVSAGNYVNYMTIAPNLGNNPAPQFKRSVSITGSLTIQSGSGDLFVHGHKQFNGGMFQNNTTLSGSAGVSQSIELPVTDLSYGVSISNSSRITVANAGVYNIQFSAQCEAPGGADTVYIWFKKNGTNITDSATKVVMPNNTAQTMTVNILAEAAANDYFELAWQNANGTGRILSEAASGNIPLIPAVIVTVTQVR